MKHFPGKKIPDLDCELKLIKLSEEVYKIQNQQHHQRSPAVKISESKINNISLEKEFKMVLDSDANIIMTTVKKTE